METAITDSVVTSQVAAPAVAPPPPPPPEIAPAVQAPMPQMNEGGSSVMETLKSLNWVEVGFGILGTAALFYAIYYYKYSINSAKMVETRMQNQLDEINIKLSDFQSVLEANKKAKTTTNNLGFSI